MEKVLLHSCCAPCSAAILEWMGQNGYEPTILFYNPNIFPEEEYLKRKHEIVRYAQEIGVAIVDLDGENTGEKDNAEVSAGYEGTDGRQGGHGDFWERQHEQWLECTVGLENEPERGGRCLACFKHRLCTAASYAANRGFPLFTTTLASSRWKDIRQINEAGFYAEEHCGRMNAATSSPASSTTSSTAAASSALPTALRPKATAHIPTNHKAPDIGLSTTLSINCTQISCSMP